MKRTDIHFHDVFISWTGNDRAIKNQIKEYLEENGIRCLESDHSCSGDFRRWSTEAVHACNVFLLILTPSTLNSTFVPLELASLQQMAGFEDRLIPVCSDMETYQQEPWGIHSYASAVFLNNTMANDAQLQSILHKTQSLLINQMERIYREATKPDYIKLIPFLKVSNVANKQYAFCDLYIPRHITEIDSEGLPLCVFSSPEELCKSRDILFISGPAGSGKSRYIDQWRLVADQETVTISLPCHCLANSSSSLTELMYLEFCRCCGNAWFYTSEDFQTLLRHRHLLLVLDGMDEIATADAAAQLLAKVEAYYTTNHQHTTLLFTGRNEQDAQLISMAGKQVRRFALDPLNETDILTLSQNLFRLFGAENKHQLFYDQVMNLKDEIKTNPLLLSQLAIVYHNSRQIPRTVVEIYDAIVEITFAFDKTVTMSQIPSHYQHMITHQIPTILKAFSAERYRLISEGHHTETTKIFCHVLRPIYEDERQERAAFLVNYLQNRAILLNGEFYHKMLLEYFTAVYFYEHSFDDYDTLENPDVITDLFTHYTDPYWSEVVRLFLIKADTCMDVSTAKKLYHHLTTLGITDYTLLLDTYTDLPRHKQQALVTVLSDMLIKSAQKVYPPYGPLFWYVPHYQLYEALLLAANDLRFESGFGAILSLVRDVCYIYGQVYTVSDITDQVSGDSLFQAAKTDLQGVRAALCELFCLGYSDYVDGSDIYPRCFNLAEVRNFMEYDHGLAIHPQTPFEDELDLFAHECYNELNGEWIGLVACPYHKPNLIKAFSKHRTIKVSGLVLSPTMNTVFTYLPIFRKNLRVIWFPENCTAHSTDYTLHLNLLYGHLWTADNLVYIKQTPRFTVPGFVKDLPENALKSFGDLQHVVISEGVETVQKGALRGLGNIECLELPSSLRYLALSSATLRKIRRIRIPLERLDFFSDKIPSLNIAKTQKFSDTKQIDLMIDSNIDYGRVSYRGDTSLNIIKVKKSDHLTAGSFEDCINLRDVKLPNNISVLPKRLFKNCIRLVDVMMPTKLLVIDEEAFACCSAMHRVYLPGYLQRIEARAFRGCIGFQKVFLPNSLQYIGPQAFSGCANLCELHLPPSITFIAADAFEDCPQLRLVRIPVGIDIPLPFDSHVEQIPYYPKAMDGTGPIPPTPSSNTRTTALAPAELEIKHNEELTNAKYYEHPDLRKILFHSGVTIIPKQCFMLCKQLEKVELSDTIYNIKKEAFSGCTSLTRVHHLRAVRSIGTRAFANCTALQAIHFRSFRLLSIGNGAFENCTGLTHLKLPKSLRSIGSRAFFGCTNLVSVELSANFKDQIDDIFGPIDKHIIRFVY